MISGIEEWKALGIRSFSNFPQAILMFYWYFWIMVDIYEIRIWGLHNSDASLMCKTLLDWICYLLLWAEFIALFIKITVYVDT